MGAAEETKAVPPAEVGIDDVEEGMGVEVALDVDGNEAVSTPSPS